MWIGWGSSARGLISNSAVHAELPAGIRQCSKRFLRHFEMTKLSAVFPRWRTLRPAIPRDPFLPSLADALLSHFGLPAPLVELLQSPSLGYGA